MVNGSLTLFAIGSLHNAIAYRDGPARAPWIYGVRGGADLARLKKYRCALAAFGALALAAGLAPTSAVGQVVDPFEEQPRDQDEIFDDAAADRRGLRGRLEPEQDGDTGSRRRDTADQDPGNRDAAGQDTAEVLFRESPDPFRDPLTAPGLDVNQREQSIAVANGAGQGAQGADETEEDPYAALGVRVGSFVLFPELSVETLYDDNLFLSTTSPRGDRVLVLTPSLRVESDWSRNSLAGTLSGVRSYYDRFPSEDDETFSAGVTGRLDIRRNTNLTAGASYSQSLEDRSSRDFPSGTVGRAETRNRDVSLEGNQGFNRVTVTLRGEISEEDFDDGTNADGSVNNNDDRDLTERRVTARASYEFQPGVAAFLEAAFNKRVFAESVDDDGTRNGSSGQDVQGGLSFQLTGKLTGEISAGYARQIPEEATLSDITGLIFNAGLEWRATGLTTLRLDASSDVNETTQAGSAGSIVRSVAISIEHSPRRNITLGASLGYEREESSGSGDLDEDIEFALTGEYNFTRSAALTAAYSYLDSTSNTPDSDYSVNEFRLGVRLRR